MAYIGGRLSYGEREARYLRRLRKLPLQEARWPLQCRCGTYGYVTYRGRAYCPRCGRRWSEKGMALLRALKEGGTDEGGLGD